MKKLLVVVLTLGVFFLLGSAILAKETNNSSLANHYQNGARSDCAGMSFDCNNSHHYKHHHINMQHVHHQHSWCPKANY